jgi:hypothetical protein
MMFVPHRKHTYGPSLPITGIALLSLFIINFSMLWPGMNMDMRFGTWNVRSLYRAGSLMTVSREVSRYMLDFLGVQEVRWEGSGTAPAGEYKYLYGKGNENHELGTGFLVCKRIYQQLRGWSVLVKGCHT